jgi:outer membrane protein OmpA-like peptidoglycan-associated protein
MINRNKILRVTILLLMVFSGFKAFSQDSDTTDTTGNIWKTGWHVDAGGGVQVLFSSDVKNLSFMQRFTPLISLSAGKWFSPFWGVRLQLSGYSLNGFSTLEGTYLSNPDPVRSQVTIRPDGSYRHYLRYLNAHAAVEVSLRNLIDGYKENRRWDIIPSAGFGYLRSLGYKGTPATNNLSTHFSLKGKYALTSSWDINLESSSAVFNGDFDGRITSRKYEAYSGITLGVSYNFSKPKYKPRYRSNTQIQALELAAKDTVKVSDEKKPLILASILFGLNKIEPLEGQDIYLINVVKYLNENPNVRIRLAGYGDKETGTPKYNFELADKRVKVLCRTLIEVYGVDAGRIETQVLGSDYQPYAKSEWNRVVTITVIGGAG